MLKVERIEDLSKEELLELNKIYAKNWLAHDGLWFQSIEEKHGRIQKNELCPISG